MTIQPFLTVADLAVEGAATGFFRLDARVSDVAGAIDVTTDEDYFLFSPFPNTRYRITADSSLDTQLGLFSMPDLSRVAQDDDGGPGLNPEIVLDTGSTPEAFLIEVDVFGFGEPGDFPFSEGASYTLQIEDLGQISAPPPLGTDVTGGVPSTGGGIVPGEPVLDQLDFFADVDSFSLFVEAGTGYRAFLDGTGAAGGSIDAPFLRLLEQTGAEIAVSEDFTGRTTRIDFVAPFTGFVSLEVTDRIGDVGGYALTVEETARPVLSGSDRVGNTFSTAAIAEAYEPAFERIESGDDFDLYQVALKGGDRYRADLIGLDGLDPTLSLINSSGREVAFSDDFGSSLDSRIDFTPLEDDFFFLRVGGFGNSTGNYDLLVEPIRTVAATIDEAQSIALLFEASFGRQANFVGLNFWVDSLELGDSLVEISQEFIDSPEFTAVSGNPNALSDGAFVDALSINVLGRLLAQGGFDFWTGRLDDGASRAQVLLAFATIEENAAQSPNVATIGQIGQADDLSPALIPDDTPEWDFFVA